MHSQIFPKAKQDKLYCPNIGLPPTNSLISDTFHRTIVHLGAICRLVWWYELGVSEPLSFDYLVRSTFVFPITYEPK